VIQPLEGRKLFDSAHPVIPQGMQVVTVGNLTTWSRTDSDGDGLLDPADTITALFTDVDGDEVTFKLDGAAGSIAWTTNIDGSIDTLYVNTTDPSKGTFTVSIASGAPGDGRVAVGQLYRDDAGNDVDVIVSKINAGLLDFNGAGAFLDSVSSATFGDFTGSSGVTGSVSKIVVRDVNTSGGFSLANTTDRFDAASIALATITADDLRTLDVNGDAVVDLVLGTNAGTHTVSKIDIAGNAAGAWSAVGAVLVNSVKIGGNASLELTGVGPNPMDLKNVQIKGVGLSVLDFDVNQIDKFDLFGDAIFISGSSIAADAPNFRVRGDFDGDLTVAGDTGKFRIDGLVADTATFTLNTPDVSVYGLMKGTWTLLDPTKMEARAGMDDISVILTGTTSGKIRVRGDFDNGVLILGAANVAELRIDGDFSVGASVLSTGAVTSLRAGDFTGSAIVGSSNSFKVDDIFNGTLEASGLVNTVSVKNSASGSLVALGGFGNMTFGSISNLLISAGFDEASDPAPTVLGDFENQAATITKITVKQTTTLLDLFAPTIGSFDLKTLTVDGITPTTIISSLVSTAKFTVGATKYTFNSGSLFTSDPNLPGLTLTQL